MNDIVLLDTTVYLNILDVPGFNQSRDEILDDFEGRVRKDDLFLLPMAALLETGNHISHLPNGCLRRQFAEKFVQDVNAALNGDAPYRPTYFPERQVFSAWLVEFPNYAQRSKSIDKSREGVTLSDFSIIKEWERSKDTFSMSRVLIWSLDSDLIAFDTGPR